MASVVVFTAERMKEIEDETIVDARLENFELILVRKSGEEVNVGNVRGLQGPPGTDELRWKTPVNPLSGTPATNGGDAQPLRMQAGSNVITTDIQGNATITFPEVFIGIGAVVAQVGSTNDPTYTHLNEANYPNATVSAGNINVITHDLTLANFKVRLTAPGGADMTFGLQNPDTSLGGCGPVRINWMAFGW